jgi:N-acetylmuramoyl-L-alanine amidase
VETWLVPDDRRDFTPDRYHPGNKPRRIKPIEAVVLHYTAGQSPRGVRNWLTRRDSHYVSSHFLVERDGEVWQLAPLEDRTFHAGGRSSKLFGAGNVNGRTIGIELMNAGPVRENEDGEWVTWSGKRFRHAGVCVGHPRSNYWEAYTAPLLETLCEFLVPELIAEFPVLESPSNWVGHEHVDPSRKTDPGPAFPWEVLKRAVRKYA